MSVLGRRVRRRYSLITTASALCCSVLSGAHVYSGVGLGADGPKAKKPSSEGTSSATLKKAICKCFAVSPSERTHSRMHKRACACRPTRARMRKHTHGRRKTQRIWSDAPSKDSPVQLSAPEGTLPDVPSVPRRVL